MNKILELLETLPEPYSKQAIENYDPSFYSENVTISDRNEALGWAFDWSKSPQGEEYWMALRRHLERGEPLPGNDENTIAVEYIIRERKHKIEDMEHLDRYIENLNNNVGLTELTYKEIKAKISSVIAQCEISIRDHQTPQP